MTAAAAPTQGRGLRALGPLQPFLRGTDRLLAKLPEPESVLLVSLAAVSQSFTFGWNLGPNIVMVSLFANLPSFSFRDGFNKCMENVSLPAAPCCAACALARSSRPHCAAAFPNAARWPFARDSCAASICVSLFVNLTAELHFRA